MTDNPTKNSAIQLERIFISGPQGRSHTLHHRGSPADLGVIEQIFARKDYDLARLSRGREIHDAFQAIVNLEKRPMIVDAGANIGASIAWFNLLFPESKIIGIEPDVNNFNILKLNSPMANVDLYRAAVGSSKGMGRIVNPGASEWSYKIESSERGEIEIISMNDIVHRYKELGHIPFIAKIDIEGGESDLFSTNTQWVDHFPLLIVELHDWMLPKSANSSNFLKCISHLDRDFVYINENIFSIKNDIQI